MFGLESEKNNDDESIMKWFHEEIGQGENSILVYPQFAIISPDLYKVC